MASEGSGKVSTRKTFKYRVDYLLPAGLCFGEVEDLEPFPAARSLVQLLLNVDGLLSPSQIEQFEDKDMLPSSIVQSAGEGMASWPTFNVLMTAARLSKKSSSYLKKVMGRANESEWRVRCHTSAMATLQTTCEGFIEQFTEEDFGPLSLEKVHLGPNRPDYTWAVPILGNKPAVPPLERLAFPFVEAATAHGLDPYVNGNKRMIFPLVCTESKSYQGIPVEAENQCADDAIKMLSKLRSVGGSAASLPVFSISIIGASVAVYASVANLSTTGGGAIEFIMCEIWSGDFRKLWEGFFFQIILHRIGTWINSTALPVLNESLARFDDRVRAVQSLPAF